MSLKYFSYNNKTLIEYGCVMCSFGDINNIVTFSIPQLTFNTIKLPSKNRRRKYSTEYADSLTTTISICKDIGVTGGTLVFTSLEVSRIYQWLDTKTYKKLKILDSTYFDGVYYNAAFTSINQVKHNGDVIGFELTIQTDLPYACGDDVDKNIVLSGEVQSDMIFNTDEYGFYYPSDMTITINEAGNLTLSNTLDSRSLYIANCELDEVITIDNENQIITTSSMTHNIYDDFNYNFFRLVSDVDNGNVNGFESTIDVQLDFTYSPAKKVGIV